MRHALRIANGARRWPRLNSFEPNYSDHEDHWVIAGGWIGFVLADKALFEGRMARAVPELVRAIAAGFGLA
jgi:hypothetical protein